VPLFMALASCFDGSADMIASHLINALGINEDAIAMVKQHIPFLFVFDGFDEIYGKFEAATNSKARFTDFIGVDEWLSTGVGAHLVTCRSNTVDDSEINRIFSNATKQTTYLAPFSKMQINAYIEKFANDPAMNTSEHEWDATHFKAALGTVNGISEMICEPLLLSIVLSVLPALTLQSAPSNSKDGDPNTRLNVYRCDLYSAFTDKWFNDTVAAGLGMASNALSNERLKIIFQRFAQNVALWMMHNQTFVLQTPKASHEYLHANTGDIAGRSAAESAEIYDFDFSYVQTGSKSKHADIDAYAYNAPLDVSTLSSADVDPILDEADAASDEKKVLLTFEFTSIDI